MAQKSCFFGLEVLPGSKCKHTPTESYLHISQAAIPYDENEQNQGCVTLYCAVEGKSFALGTLNPQKGVLHMPIDLNFMPGQEIEFYTQTKSKNTKVHITGYYEQEDIDDDADDDEEEEEEENDMAPIAMKMNPLSTAQNQLSKERNKMTLASSSVTKAALQQASKQGLLTKSGNKDAEGAEDSDDEEDEEEADEEGEETEEGEEEEENIEQPSGGKRHKTNDGNFQQRRNQNGAPLEHSVSRGRGGFQQQNRGRGGFQQQNGGRGGFQQQNRGRGGFQQQNGGRGGFQQQNGGRGGFQRGQSRGNFRGRN